MVGQDPHSLFGSQGPVHASYGLAPKTKLSPQKQLASDCVFHGVEEVANAEQVLAAADAPKPWHEI